MGNTYIEYDNKKYELKELTIERWQNIMKYKNLLDEADLYVKMISEMTGLTPEQVREGDARSINETGTLLYSYINQDNKEVFYNITFKDIEYQLVDFSNMTFGQFVDIDTFIQKDESYKISNLNELAAYLFTEKGKKYGETDFKKTIESFKDLPVKYIEGAVFFLWTLERGLAELSVVYSENRFLLRTKKIQTIFRVFGGTIFGFLSSRRTKFGKLVVLLASPLFFVSTIYRTLMTYVSNRRRRLNKK